MSQLEDLLISQVVLAQLPPHVVQFRFSPPRRWRWDLCFLPQKLAVEVQGGTWARMAHTRGKGYELDCEKANEATIQGWRLIRVTGDMVKDGRALIAIQRALIAKGAETCPKLCENCKNFAISATMEG